MEWENELDDFLVFLDFFVNQLLLDLFNCIVHPSVSDVSA